MVPVRTGEGGSVAAVLPLPGSPVYGEQIFVAVLNASALRHANIMTLESLCLSSARITIHRRFAIHALFHTANVPIAFDQIAKLAI